MIASSPKKSAEELKARWNAAEDYNSDDEICAVLPQMQDTDKSRIVFCVVQRNESVASCEFPLVVITPKSEPCPIRDHSLKRKAKGHHKRARGKEEAKALPPRRKSSQEQYVCTVCERVFVTRQGLGGHMSKSHPGASEAYRHKKETRDSRELERAKLILAKKQYYSQLGINYEQEAKTEAGRERLKAKLCRKRLREVKRGITDEEAVEYIKLGKRVHKSQAY